MLQHSLIDPGGPRADTSGRYSRTPMPWGPLPMGNMLCYPWKLVVPEGYTGFGPYI